MTKPSEATLGYHIGFLPYDRLLSQEVDTKATEAWNNYIAGKVILAQRRVAPGVFEYLAIPRRKRAGKQIDYVLTAVDLATTGRSEIARTKRMERLGYERTTFFERALAA